MMPALRFVGIGALAIAGALLCVTTAFDRTGERGAVMPLATRLAIGPAITWRLAARAIEDRRPDRAAILVRQAIARDPVRPDALALLGLLDLVDRQPDKARAAYLVSGAMGWREPMTQMYWLNDGLATGDVTVVAQRLDALQRTGVSNQSVPAASMTLEQVAEGRAALAKRLENSPLWVASYLAAIPSLPSGAAIDARVATLSAGRKRGMKLDCRAVGTVARSLALDIARYGDAAAKLWFTLCRPDVDRRAGLADSSFARADDEADSPFAWTPTEQGEIDVRVEQAPGQTRGDALYIQSDSTVAEPVARRLVVLSPGPYRIGWRIAAGTSPRTELATVSVACAGSTSPLADTIAPAPRPGSGSGLHTTSIVVPATGCPLQWVTISAEPKTLDGPTPFYIFDLKTMAAR